MLTLDSITMLVGFITIFFAICCIKIHCNILGYYWRDLTGEIPTEALRGGSTVNDKPIYIGQVLYKHMLIPAKIYWNDSQTAFFEHENWKELATTQNIKILCTQYPYNFVWIKTSTDMIDTTRRLHSLIIGGYEPGCTTYIGRTLHRGEVTVGKVLTDNEPGFDGLHVTKDGEGERYTVYEVLSYKPYQPIPDNIRTHQHRLQ